MVPKIWLPKSMRSIWSGASGLMGEADVVNNRGFKSEAKILHSEIAIHGPRQLGT